MKTVNKAEKYNFAVEKVLVIYNIPVETYCIYACVNYFIVNKPVTL